MGEGPVEPGEECGGVFGVDGGAAPDADTGRGVAVAAEVVGDIFAFETLDEFFGFGGLFFGTECLVPGIHDLEANGGVGSGGGIFREEVDPVAGFNPVGNRSEVGFRAFEQGGEAADGFGPLETVDGVFDAEHGDGIDGGAFKNALGEFAAFGHAEDFRERPGGCVGFEAFDGPRAEDDHAVGGFAAHYFLPGPGDDIEFAVVEVHGEDGGGGVAEDESFALLRDPVEVGDADAGGGAVVGEDDVVIEINGTEVGKFSVVGFVAGDVLELELLDHIGDPGRAERFPGANVESACTEEGPHGHLNGAGVGGGYDTADIAFG